MLALGVPDARPDRLPELVADLLADDDALLVGRAGGLAPDVRDRVVADLGRYAELCGRLADGGIPATLQHDDLHDANVFVVDGPAPVLRLGRRRPSPTRSSACWWPCGWRGRRSACPNGDPVLLRLRDAYLDVVARPREPGSSCASRCDLALQVGPLQRALTWRRILRGVHPDERAEWAGSVPGLDGGAPRARHPDRCPPPRLTSADCTHGRHRRRRPGTSWSPAPSSCPPPR